MSKIVVGVDGSPGSVDALRFALDEARLRGADAEAVAAWRVPPAVYNSGFVPIPVDLSDYERLAKEALDKALEEAKASGDGVSVTPILREGHAAEVLVTEANEAELLVVGSRGLGGFGSLLLGSVSQYCSHHAP